MAADYSGRKGAKLSRVLADSTTNPAPLPQQVVAVVVVAVVVVVVDSLPGEGFGPPRAEGHYPVLFSFS